MIRGCVTESLFLATCLLVYIILSFLAVSVESDAAMFMLLYCTADLRNYPTISETTGGAVTSHAGSSKFVRECHRPKSKLTKWHRRSEICFDRALCFSIEQTVTAWVSVSVECALDVEELGESWGKLLHPRSRFASHLLLIAWFLIPGEVDYV